MSWVGSLAGGSALRAGVLSFASPKESSQRKGDPGVGALRVPCATRLSGLLAKLACGSNNASRNPPDNLRCSAPLTGTRKTSTLNFSSQKTGLHGRLSGNSIFFNSFNPPRPPYQGGATSARDDLLLPLTRGRPGQAETWPPLFGGLVGCLVVSSGGSLFTPVEGAEQRRLFGGLPLALSEPQASLASGPDSRVAQGTGVAGADPGVAFSLATFFWRSKRKYARPPGGTPSQSKPQAPALENYQKGAPA